MRSPIVFYAVCTIPIIALILGFTTQIPQKYLNGIIVLALLGMVIMTRNDRLNGREN